jgi:CheY-like chemotaxis protein
MESGWRGSGTVLVVDDDKMARETAATLLAHLGFEVLQAVDGTEALSRFLRSTHSICGVLLDATIPGLEGREVARRLRASRPDLPLLLASGYGEGEVMKSYAGVHVNGFVQKPFELGRLSGVLKSLLPEVIADGGKTRSTDLVPNLPQKAVWAGKIVQSWV